MSLTTCRCFIPHENPSLRRRWEAVTCILFAGRELKSETFWRDAALLRGNDHTRRGRLFLMFIPLSLACFALVGLVSTKAQEPLRLMPLPAEVRPGEGYLVIDNGFCISLSGYHDAVLQSAAARLMKNLSAKTGLLLSNAPNREGKAAALRVHCDGADVNFLTPKADESYTLDITPQGAELRAHGPAGVLRGMASFFQLVHLDAVGFRAPVVKITDQPRFAWRGLMIDVARHFISIDTLKRNLDAMELAKMNVLHLHLSDAEGFRVESKIYPKLQQMGSNGEFYTQKEIGELVAYARDRGIRIVPEIEMPGHAKAMLVAYPELAAMPGPYALGPGPDVMNATIDPTREVVYEFLDRLLGEMSALFPDQYFHSGGDEVNGAQWAQNSKIQAFMKARGLGDKHGLQAYFSERVRQILAKHGKTMMSWDEVLQSNLSKDVVVQAWRSSKLVQKSTALGHPTLVSAGYYLDYELPASAYYGIDPYDSRAYGIHKEDLQRVKGTPLEPYITEDNVATDSPLLTSAEEHFVVGGIACIWSEFVWDEKEEGEVWPRVGAIAERLWSPEGVKDVTSMYRRLASLSVDLDCIGLRHRSNEMRMLQQLAGDHAAGPLATLAEAVEPIKHLARYGPRVQAALASGKGIDNTLVSTRFVDAIPPESLAAQHFCESVRLMLAAPEGSGELPGSVRAKLTEWRDNDVRFQEVARDSFLLKEVIPASQDLRDLADAGLEAMTLWESKQSPSLDWLAKQKSLLEKHRKTAQASSDAVAAMMSPQPPHELINVIAPAIQDLVSAAAQGERPSTTRPN
jgi:hexosaminidase